MCLKIKIVLLIAWGLKILKSINQLIDVRIFNPQAKSNWNKSVQKMNISHDDEYGARA